MTSRNLVVGLLNPGSLCNKHDELPVAVDRHPVDILAINETWLAAGEEGRAPRVPGYRLRHVPRPPGERLRGGGVGFYIRRGINVRTCTHPEAPPVEQMWLSLVLNSIKIVIGTAYRPPWLDVDTFLDAITESVAAFSRFERIILLGDFNINLLQPEHIHVKKLSCFLNNTGLSQFIDRPTHFTDRCETLLDVICTNARCCDIAVNHIHDLSSHAYITCTLDIRKNKPKAKWISYRPLKNIDRELFNEHLDLIDWTNFMSLSDVNVMVNTFNSYIAALFDTHAPVKKIKVKEQSYPWITPCIKKMMQIRDAARRRFHTSNLESHGNYYKDLKRLVVISIDNEKAAYFKQHINFNINNPRKLWKNIKITTYTDDSITKDLPACFDNPDDINRHFLTLPGNDTASLSDLTFLEFHRYGDSTLALKPVNETIVLNIIRKLKSNARGIDDISLNMILLTLPQTLGPITSIINTSIENGVYPDIWKMAMVQPIPKKTHPNDMADLRPISILPILSKVLEKVVCFQMNNYLESNNMFPEFQSGFRRDHSTSTALIDVVDNIITAQDSGDATILTLLDFSRAFDTINTALLLSKMSYYGFDNKAIRWFNSYLTNRTQQVRLLKQDGSTVVSDALSVTRGVPQGSILGPVLFILYCADLTKSILNCKYHMYADDTQIYISFKPSEPEQAFNRMNEDLDRLAEWSIRNTLVLNPNKSKYMILGTSSQITKVENLGCGVSIGSGPIERTKEARNLGVYMDDGLRFEGHLQRSVSACFYRLRVLYRMRKYIDVALRVRLCEALVLSKINYADVVYGPRLLARSERLMQRVHNACARFCFKIPPRSHVTPFLNNNNLLNMKMRRRLHLATLLFGVTTLQRPSYLFSKMKWQRDLSSRKHQLRGARPHHLQLPPYRTAAFRGGFKYAATKCWNNLPPPLYKSLSRHAFKCDYRRHLLRMQVSNT